jgi:hypothetical protein
MIPSGRGFRVPPPLQVAAPSEHDARLRRQLVGAFEPWVGWAIVNEGLLCFSENGQSLTFVTREQAQAVLTAIGNPAGYELCEVLAVDREAAPRTLV